MALGPGDNKTGAGPERFLRSRDELENYLFLLKARDEIRGWLKLRGYLEVLIPVLSPETVPDLNLDSFSVGFESVFKIGEKRKLFLQTSPELLLKRMLASGFKRIFYLGPVFRQGEFAEKHHPEFTMAEWYHAGYSYLDLMAELEEMLSLLFLLKTPIPKITMQEALIQAAGIDFLSCHDKKRLACAIKEKNTYFKSRGMGWADLFEYAVVEWLSPWLEKRDAVFIYNWPGQTAMQGKLLSSDQRVAERFELYIRGIEIANGYTESTDAAEMEKRFKAEIRKRRALKRPSIPLPAKFLSGLKLGAPEAAGVSLGVERLCLALLGLNNMDQLMAYREI